MAETLNCVSLLKKTNPNIFTVADIWTRCKDFLPIKEGGLKPPSAYSSISAKLISKSG